MEFDDYRKIKESVSKNIHERLSFDRDLTDEEVEIAIDEELTNNEMRVYSLSVRRKLKREIFDSMRRLDILQLFVEDSDITEIMINGENNIFIEKRGKIEKLKLQFDSRERLGDVIQQIAAMSNRVVNEASPIVDTRLMDGSRVNIVLPPVALNGPIVTIRKFPDKAITINQLIEMKSITKEAADFLELLVKAKYNIFISGGTGSGKTTLLNALSAFIPADERIITIEDSAELQLLGLENLVRLETRNKNVEGCEEVSIRDLIKTSLRMRPDRIVVGEVRGAEAVDMMQCLNTGHDGSMSTGHANSAKDILARLENMILMGMDIPLNAIRQQIASGIDIIVQLGRLRDKSRRVLEIVEIDKYDEGRIVLNPIYIFEEKGGEADGLIRGELEKKGELLHKEKLKAAGYIHC